jgi:hypothetical protein
MLSKIYFYIKQARPRCRALITIWSVAKRQKICPVYAIPDERSISPLDGKAKRLSNLEEIIGRKSSLIIMIIAIQFKPQIKILG